MGGSRRAWSTTRSRASPTPTVRCALSSACATGRNDAADPCRRKGDVPVIAELIRGLARFERLEDQVTMTEEKLTRSLFGDRPYAETLIAEDDGQPVGFALFFHNFSTFLGRPGLYLEDLFVLPEGRGKGVGR